MYNIKQSPDDFVVNEVCRLPEDEGRGRQYSYFIMSKRGLNTHDALRMAAKRLNMPMKFAGYAGLKDKNSVSSQLVSFREHCGEKIENLGITGISFRLVGYGSTPVTVGCLEGNKFRIAVRNFHGHELEAAALEKAECGFSVPNFFGEQRFGKCNHLIGKAIVKGQFQEAAKLISESGNNSVGYYLSDRKNDFVGAVVGVGKEVAILYVHSYQAYIFNECISEYLKYSALVDEAFPIVGFATEIGDYNEKVRRVVLDVMKREGVSFNDFVVRKVPQLSCEGSDRKMLAEVSDFSFIISDDELNAGMKKCVLCFYLPKGSYATVVIKCLFG